jgi:hypothetical protein
MTMTVENTVVRTAQQVQVPCLLFFVEYPPVESSRVRVQQDKRAPARHGHAKGKGTTAERLDRSQAAAAPRASVTQQFSAQRIRPRATDSALPAPDSCDRGAFELLRAAPAQRARFQLLLPPPQLLRRRACWYVRDARKITQHCWPE